MIKILVVEDEDIIRKGIIYTIDWLKLGYTVVGEACNGLEGLEKINELQPDVVIADIKMPKMDGISMIREAKKDFEFECIILTSYAEFDYAKQAIDLHVFSYFLKPIDEYKFEELMLNLRDKILNDQKLKLMIENYKLGMDINYYYELALTQNELVAKSISEIKTHYADKISIEVVADKLGVSASYLSRKFKEIVCSTFLDFLNQYRVQQAVKLLHTGKYKVYEISDMTGFSDYKHFCSVFKKYMQTSPTHYVKNKKI